jgi:hypothetical protein
MYTGISILYNLRAIVRKILYDWRLSLPITCKKRKICELKSTDMAKIQGFDVTSGEVLHSVGQSVVAFAHI